MQKNNDPVYCIARTDKDICSCPGGTMFLNTWTMRGKIKSYAKEHEMEPVDVVSGTWGGPVWQITALASAVGTVAKAAGFGIVKLAGALSRPSRKRLPACIEKFDGLKGIDVSNNGLETLDNIDKAKNLVYLHAGNNKLKKITSLPRTMEQLDLSDNKIEKIENLESLEKLRELNLGGNKIGKIEGLDTLKKLESINVANNLIRTIDGTENLDSVKELMLENNPLSFKDFDEKGKEIKSMSMHRFDAFVKELAKMDSIEKVTIYPTANYAQAEMNKWLQQRHHYKHQEEKQRRSKGCDDKIWDFWALPGSKTDQDWMNIERECGKTKQQILCSEDAIRTREGASFINPDENSWKFVEKTCGKSRSRLIAEST